MIKRELLISEIIEHCTLDSMSEAQDKFVKILEIVFESDDKIKFSVCDGEGLLEHLDLDADHDDCITECDEAKAQWGLYEEDEILLLRDDIESIEDEMKAEILGKMMKLELSEIELMLKPHADRLGLVLHDHYLFKLRTENALKP